MKTAARVVGILTYFGGKVHHIIPSIAFLRSPVVRVQLTCSVLPRESPGALSHISDAHSWTGKMVRLLLQSYQHRLVIVSWVFPGICGSEHALTTHMVLILSFAVLTGDKAATAKNDRTQEDPPERAGKGCVFSVSSAGFYRQVLALLIPKA